MKKPSTRIRTKPHTNTESESGKGEGTPPLQHASTAPAVLAVAVPAAPFADEYNPAAGGCWVIDHISGERRRQQ